MFYLLDKPEGITSFKAIKSFAKQKGIKKIGHTGTLDPLATGLLLVATEDDTKLIDYIDKGFKSYNARMLLGKQSDTYDVEGQITSEMDVTFSEKEIIKALKSFEGTMEQMPPIFSAKKIDGQKAYDLARMGKEVKLKSSTVTMKDFRDITFVDKKTIEFKVTVSRGTYIRSLIHDLGQKLGCGAIMTGLRRISIGNLTEKEIDNEVSILSLLTLPTIETSSMKDLLNGKIIATDFKDGTYALKYQQDIFGIIEVKDKKMKPKKLIGNKFAKAGFNESYKISKQTSKSKKTLVMGAFNSFHNGHLELIEAAKKRKKPIVVMLIENINKLVSKSTPLNTLDIRLQQLANNGVDYAFVVDFNKVALKPGKEFLKELQELTNAEHFIAGKDFAMGRNRDLKISQIENSTTIPMKKIGDKKISTTILKDLIAVGDVKLVRSLAPQHYQMKVNVKSDNKVTQTGQGLPHSGVYSIWVDFNDIRYTGLLHISMNKTVMIEVPDFQAKNVGYSPIISFVKMVRKIYKADHDKITKEDLIAGNKSLTFAKD